MFDQSFFLHPQSWKSQKKNSKIYTKSLDNDSLRIAEPKDIVALGAAQDGESAVSTEDGSLFTDGITDTLIKKPNITFIKLRDDTERHIREICIRIKTQTT